MLIRIICFEFGNQEREGYIWLLNILGCVCYNGYYSFN